MASYTLTTMAANQFQSQQSSATIIDQPRPNDVLCGRGKSTFRHEGNQRFRELIGEHADTYKMATTKKQKMQVIVLITDIIIARGGRFMVSDNKNHWVNAGAKHGRKKVGHSLRDALRGRSKCIGRIINDHRDAQLSDNSSDAPSETGEYQDYQITSSLTAVSLGGLYSEASRSDQKSIPALTSTAFDWHCLTPTKGWNSQLDTVVDEDAELLTFFLGEYLQ